MGWFTPKCPNCGGPLEETGYSIGCPTHRCNNCISRNREIKKSQDKIDSLEKRVKELEGKR